MGRDAVGKRAAHGVIPDWREGPSHGELTGWGGQVIAGEDRVFAPTNVHVALGE